MKSGHHRLNLVPHNASCIWFFFLILFLSSYIRFFAETLILIFHLFQSLLKNFYDNYFGSFSDNFTCPLIIGICWLFHLIYSDIFQLHSTSEFFMRLEHFIVSLWVLFKPLVLVHFLSYLCRRGQKKCHPITTSWCHRGDISLIMSSTLYS